MGISTRCGIMPFGTYLNAYSGDYTTMPKFEGHGWELEEDSVEIDDIYYEKYVNIKRPHLIVYLVNVSPHSYVGRVDVVATAYSQESLREFISVWAGSSCKISTRMKVYQTL